MAEQDYSLPLASTTFANSRPKWNNASDALRADFWGPTAPSPTVAYMRWADTTTNLLKIRNSANSAWITMWKIDVQHGGLVALDTAGQAMTVDLSMGGKLLTNLGAPVGALDAARKQEQDLKAPLSAPAFTGDVTLDQDPASGNSAVRKSFTDATYIPLAGGTMTGDLGLPAGVKAAGEAMRRDDIEGITSFSLSGHDHDGVNSKLISIPTFNFFTPVSKVNATADSGGWVTVDVSGQVASGARTCILVANISIRINTSTSHRRLRVLFRETGTTPGADGIGRVQYQALNAGDRTGEIGQQIFVPLDTSQQFDYDIDLFATAGTGSFIVDIWVAGDFS